uniref:hypothetical protein n=1 Tax=Cypionkella sp. TaxID=2811411 RepID=UPI003752199F
MADQINFTPLRALDRNGLPVAAAEALFYISGTSTLQTVYSDSAGTTPHAQPLVADARGVFPQVFSNVTLKVTVTDPLGAVLPGFPLDPVPKTAIGGTGAANITFAPTADIPASDTQAAIEQVQANILTTAQDLGLGVIADAPIIANLDSASTASGQYRISSTTTGTFPAGLSAASGGIVQMLRETSAKATQVVLHGGSERRSTRDLV